MNRTLGLILLIALAAVAIVVVKKTTPTAHAPADGALENAMPNASETTLALESPAFEHNGLIPPKYTCDGANLIPPLSISGVPDGAKSLALIVDDPDIPEQVRARLGKNEFDHWVVFNMPPGTREIAEGVAPEGIAGANGAGENAYTGPCPPDREHRYVFTLFALDTTLDLPEGASKEAVGRAMAGHILAQTVLLGRYDRAR